MKTLQLLILFTVFTATWFNPIRCHAAEDIFLSITGVPGESLDARFRGAIDVDKYSLNVTGMPGDSFPSGAPSKPTFGFLQVTKRADKASPILWHASASGTTFKEATLSVRKPGQTPLVYITITLTNVRVASVNLGGGTGDNRSSETIALAYEKIAYKYVPQDQRGGAGEAVLKEYDVVNRR